MRGTIARIGAAGAGAVLALGLLAAGPAGASGHKEPKAEKVKGAVHVTCLSTDGKTQGRSTSDPDGDFNRGADKPGCDGGFDADKDGNNGCGNDADREDDNNGRCGKGRPAGSVNVKPQGEVKADKPDKPDDCGVDAETGQVKADANAQTDKGDDEADDRKAAKKTDAQSADDDADDKVCPDTGTTVAGDTTVMGAAAARSGSSAGTNGTETLASGAAAPGTASDSSAAQPGTDTGVQVLGETLERGPSALARTGAGIGGLALLGGLLFGGGRLMLLARRLLRIG